jgi:hypothetical protein
MDKKEPRFLKTRKDELIGGGFFVFRRFTSSGRIRISPKGMPFEHPTFEAASLEAVRLAHANPEKKFCVLRELSEAILTETIEPNQEALDHG